MPTSARVNKTSTAYKKSGNFNSTLEPTSQLSQQSPLNRLSSSPTSEVERCLGRLLFQLSRIVVCAIDAMLTKDTFRIGASSSARKSGLKEPFCSSGASKTPGRSWEGAGATSDCTGGGGTGGDGAPGTREDMTTTGATEASLRLLKTAPGDSFRAEESTTLAILWLTSSSTCSRFDISAAASRSSKCAECEPGSCTAFNDFELCDCFLFMLPCAPAQLIWLCRKSDCMRSTLGMLAWERLRCSKKCLALRIGVWPVAWPPAGADSKESMRPELG
mmetsp:Transcript_37420/g.87830  ORF Transcript_37420/g.87830 Transcript_37420/m.87830 type:complete len:275 (-) Transcript_37420:230-1054(-)